MAGTIDMLERDFERGLSLNEVRPRWPEQFYHSYVETYGPLSQ